MRDKKSAWEALKIGGKQMKFFSVDSPLYRFLSRVLDILKLNFLWILGSLPVFTIGASTTALYYTVHKSIRGDRGYTTRTFFGAFRDNFKAATLPYLIWLAVMIVLGCDAYITYQVLKTGSMKGAFFYFFLVMIAVAIMWSAFLFPYIARFENTVKQTLKNAFLLMVRHLPWSLLLLVILIASALSIYIIPVLLVVIPAVASIVFDFILERLFRRYMSPEDLEREEENDMYAS